MMQQKTMSKSLNTKKKRRSKSSSQLQKQVSVGKEKKRPKKRLKKNPAVTSKTKLPSDSTKRKSTQSSQKRKRPIQKKKGTTTKKKKMGNSRKRKQMRKTVRQGVRDFLLILVGLLFVTVLFSGFFVTLAKVNGYSMTPTLRDADTILVRKTSDIRRLDLLVYNNRNEQDIRRVIGLPGDRIEYTDDVLYVNGNIIDEPFIIDHINEAQKNQGNYTQDFKMQAVTGEPFVPDGCYFVLGDNREWATDSREYGFIEEEQVVGVVTMRLLPINGLTAFTMISDELKKLN